MALLQKIIISESLSNLEISPEIPDRFFKLQIESETLTLVEKKLKKESFESDFQWIYEDASNSPDDPAIYLINNDCDYSAYIMIAYVPDVAMPALKMQYAYCQSTIKRSFSKLQITSSIFASALEELTYSACMDHLKRGSNSLEGLDKKSREEINPIYTSQSLKLPGMQASAMDFEVSSEIKLKLEELNSGSIHCVAIGIGDEKFYCINFWESFPIAQELPNDRPYYIVSKIESAEKHAFVYVCPESIKIKEKMISASAKQTLLSIVQDILGSKLKKEEAQNAEGTIEYLVNCSNPVFSPKIEKAFKRPKPPGRPRSQQA